MATLNHKYGNLDAFTTDKAKAGDIIMANNDTTGAIYISIADGSVRKLAGDYDASVNYINSSISDIKTTIGYDGVYNPVSNPSLTYIAGTTNIVDALVNLDKALKENGDNDEKTDSIGMSDIENMFKDYDYKKQN